MTLRNSSRTPSKSHFNPHIKVKTILRVKTTTRKVLNELLSKRADIYIYIYIYIYI